MINKRYQLICVIFPLCCLFLACNNSPPPATVASSAGEVKKTIEEVASVERDEQGNVVRISLYGSSFKGVAMDWPAEFTPVEEIVFQECPWMVDGDLEHLSGLPRLKSLTLIRVPITDRSLIALEHVESLRELQLSHTDVTGKGLRHLKDLGLEKLVFQSTKAVGAELEILGELTSLKSLTVQCPTVDIADLKGVVWLEQLEHLDVMHCSNLTEAAIADLGDLKNLKHFAFQSKAVNDQILAQICRFKGLTELDLTESTVSDMGLERVAELHELEKLVLYKSQVTGSGLRHLTGLKQLEYVLLYRSQVDQAGREGILALQSSLPDCEVDVSSF